MLHPNQNFDFLEPRRTTYSLAFAFVRRLANLAMLMMLSLLIMSLAACGHTQPITNTKYIVVRPNPSELADCNKRQPPEREVYVKLTPHEREALLATYARQLQSDLGACDNHAALRKFFDEQERIYSKGK